MAPEPLRNAGNVFSELDLRLNLTLAEASELQRWLAEPATAAVLDAQIRAELLDRLDQARTQALRLQTCPVCQQTFAQGRRGRAASYCSAACKQKAYRQRCNESKRSFRYFD